MSETRTITVKKELVYEVALVRAKIAEELKVPTDAIDLEAVVDFVTDLAAEDMSCGWGHRGDAYTFDYISDTGELL